MQKKKGLPPCGQIWFPIHKIRLPQLKPDLEDKMSRKIWLQESKPHTKRHWTQEPKKKKNTRAWSRLNNHCRTFYYQHRWNSIKFLCLYISLKAEGYKKNNYDCTSYLIVDIFPEVHSKELKWHHQRPPHMIKTCIPVVRIGTCIR